MSYMTKINQAIFLSTIITGSKIKKLTKEDLTEEERQDLEEQLEAVKKELLA